MNRRERLVGFKYRPRGAIGAEVRKACRDELKILYTGGPFGASVWKRLAALGEVDVFEASKISPQMKDIMRVRGKGLRVEGALNGELVVAFFSEGFRCARRQVEALLVGS